MRYRNKYAIVTGASSGIGRTIAVTLATAGIHVGLIARSKKGLAETLELIRGSGRNGEIFTLDLRESGQIFKLAVFLKKKWKKVNYLINVAGIYHDEKKLSLE